MTRSRSRWKQKLLAFGVSSLLVLAVLGLGEVVCRYFLDINLRKTSMEFVETDPNGFISGNARNASGVSFGVPVYSDADGFRVPPNHTRKKAGSAILLMGDSVTFGVGVAEEETFAGLLRKNLTDREILNSGVIGFSVPDYVRVADKVLPGRPDATDVYLFYCLNDFQSPDVYQPKAQEPGVWRSVKQSIAGGFIRLNEFLGPRSKLYVLITGLTIDPARQYYQNDARNMDVEEERFEQVMRPLVNIAKRAEQDGRKFTVVLNPYEVQLRKASGAGFAPQDRIRRYLETNGVRVLDTRKQFSKLDRPANAFLFADPMHLSPVGHRLVYEALAADIGSVADH